MAKYFGKKKKSLENFAFFLSTVQSMSQGEVKKK